MANIALFLGAGASVPYDLPITKEFLRDFKNTYRTQSDPILQTLLNCPEFSDVECLLEAIKNILEFKDSVGGDYYRWLSGRQDMQISLEGTLTPYDDFLRGLSNVQNMVQKEIFSTYRLETRNDHTRLNQTLGPIIRFLRLHSDKISVFTTNYDLAVEEYVEHCSNEYALVDGFKPIGRAFTFQPAVFDEDHESTSPQPIFLYKLHGSLDWIKKNGTVQRISIEPPFDDSDAYQHMLIYPTLSPKDNSREAPYSTLFEMFEANMEKVDVLIVIGHSLRDREIRDKIREQFVRGKKKLVILSPTGTSDYSKNMLGEDPSSESTDKPNPNDHTLILDQELTPETAEEILLKIDAFLADKTDTKP